MQSTDNTDKLFNERFEVDSYSGFIIR